MYNLFFNLRLRAFSLNTCFLLLVFSFVANAQEQNDIDLSKLVHIGMEQGLSSNKVNCMLQDKKGFMWFGTDYGLNRYDGYNFKVFKRDKTDSLSLTSNDIKCLAQDAKGNIWIGTAEGLNVMDYETGKITRFSYKDKSQSFGLYNITALSADDSDVWIACKDEGIIKYQLFFRQLRQYTKVVNDPDSLVRKYTINNIIVEKNGNVLAGAGSGSEVVGLLELNKQTGRITRLYLNKKIVTQKNNQVTCYSNDWIETIYKDNYGNIYVGTSIAYTAKVDKKGKTVHQYNGFSFFRNVSSKDFQLIERPTSDFSSSKSTNATNFVEYERGKILFSNDKFAMFLQLENNELITQHLAPLNLPSGIKVEKIFKDISDKLWFITQNGLETLEPAQLQVKINLIKIGNPEISEDKDSLIWFGNYTDSVTSFNSKTGKFQPYKLGKKNNIEFVTPTWVQNETIYVIKGPKLISSYNRTTSFKKIIDPKNLVNDKNVPGWDKLFLTSNGSLWVSVGEKGIAKINPQTGNPKYILPLDKMSEVNASNYSGYFDDGKRNFYLGNINQIIQIDYLNDSFKIFNISNATSGDKNNNVTSMATDNSENIWLSIKNVGLAALSIRTKKIYTFTLEDGLPTNKNSNIVFANGSIWGNYSGGIFKFVPPQNLEDKVQKPIVIIYKTKDVFPNIDLRSKAMIKCLDRRIMFCADTLLISFYPDSIASNKYAPPVFITSLSVNNKIIEVADSTKILSKNIGSTDTIQLIYKQNSFSFEYAVLNYIHSEDNNYAYKMDGLDTAWVYCGKRRFINYLNLTPGTYVFHVKGCNNDEVWSDKEAKLTIIISPPWWKRSLAYLIYAIVFFTCIFGFIRYRTGSLLKQKNILEKSVAERTKELNDSLNSLKSTQSQLIQSEKMASLGELTAGIAHEIQNPLNFVNNFSEVNNELIEELKSQKSLLDGQAGKLKNEEQDQILNYIFQNNEKINHHGKRADAIVKGMLQHSRRSSGVKEPTDINALCDEYLRLSYHGLRAKDKSFNATIKTDFDNSIGKIDIVPQEIGRVILNLLTNAFYAVNEKAKAPQPPNGENTNTLQNYEPTVTVRTSLIPPSGGGGAIIKVTDNGNGIPQNIVDKIFQPFFTTKPTGQGTGLGLSLSYDIITKGHGGELKVETKENEGSVFTILLVS